MFGLVFSSRHRDEHEHWYDPDPTVRARNKRFEDTLDRMVDGYPPPRHDEEGVMQGLWSGVLKFGVIPGAFLYLLYLIAGTLVADVRSMREAQHEHNVESRAAIVRQDRLQGVMIDLLRAQCVNSAKDYQERQACLMAGSGR